MKARSYNLAKTITRVVLRKFFTNHKFSFIWRKRIYKHIFTCAQCGVPKQELVKRAHDFLDLYCIY